MKKTVFKVPTWHPKHMISFRDMQTAVAVYDPALLMAPLKPGHSSQPGTPAFAWFKEISVDPKNQSLLVKLDASLITQAGFEAIRSGNYKHLSPEFYDPDSPYNPVPGTYYFKGLAYLGAEPPAGKGLDQITAADLTLLKLDSPPAAWAEPSVVPFREGEREEIIFNQKEPLNDGGIPVNRSKLLEFIQTKAKGFVPDDKLVSFSEQIVEAIFSGSPKFEDLNESSAILFAEKILAAELKTAKAEAEIAKVKADAEKSAAEFAETQRQAAVTSRVESLVAQGRIPPKRKEEFVAFGMAMPAVDDASLSFTEKDGKQGKRSLWDAFCAFAEEFFPVVKANLDEVAKPEEGPHFSEEVNLGKKIAGFVTPAAK